jgi:hypothetical protein
MCVYVCMCVYLCVFVFDDDTRDSSGMGTNVFNLALIACLNCTRGPHLFLIQVNANNLEGRACQDVHRDMVDTHRAGVLVWIMQVYPHTAISTMIHPATHSTTFNVCSCLDVACGCD